MTTIRKIASGRRKGREVRIDPLSPDERSERMGRILGKDTKPELIVRSLTHDMGYRYRLHVKELPGCPDMVFPSKKKVIFVHGCFWHLHGRCSHYKYPKTRLDFWDPKLRENKKRDLRNRRKLGRLGWDVLVIWECELKNLNVVQRKIGGFLG